MPKESLNHFSPENIVGLAQQMLKLEKTKLSDWDESSPFQRGEDLANLIRSSHTNISDEDCLRLAAWVDIAISCAPYLEPQDGIEVLMNTGEALSALLNLESSNYSRTEVNPFTDETEIKSFSEEIEAVYEWASDFGCLLPQGSQTDIGQWFIDFIYSYLLQIEAIKELG